MYALIDKRNKSLTKKYNIMKKFFTLLTIAAAMFVSTNSFAQTAVSSGDFILDAGISLPESIAFSVLPPITVSGEYILIDFADKFSIGVGGAASIAKSSSFATEVCAQAAIHFSPVTKLDLFAGTQEGYGFLFSEYSSFGYFAANIYTGAKYFFSDKVGAFARFEYGTRNGLLGIGLSFKF